MRDILFKAKRINNGEWVEGFVARPFSRNAEGNITNYCFNALDEMGFVSECIVSADTICQYTGLTDKDGKKIWENDIVEVWWKQRTLKEDYKPKRYKAVVEFGNPNDLYSWGWQLRFLEDFPFNNEILLWIDMDEAGAYCEVIGNIFDNFELLKGE